MYFDWDDLDALEESDIGSQVHIFEINGRIITEMMVDPEDIPTIISLLRELALSLEQPDRGQMH